MPNYNVKSKIDRLRASIGKDIHFFTPVKAACSICTTGGWYDSVTGTSTFIKCPECKGSFWKFEVKDTSVLARVHWTTNEAATITAGGKYFMGDAYAVVDPEYHTLAQTAQEPGGYVIIDGLRMTILKITPEGAPVINRLKIILTGAGSRPVS